MMKISGKAIENIDRQDARYLALQTAHLKLTAKDSTIWGSAAQAEASIRLNWIDLPESSRELLPALDALYAKHRDKENVLDDVKKHWLFNGR